MPPQNVKKSPYETPYDEKLFNVDMFNKRKQKETYVC